MTDLSVGDVVEPLVGRCATCKSWRGDKAKAATMFAENPVSMDLFNGWPCDGECDIDYRFLDIEICGDAYVAKRFDANFGCIYWSTE